MMQERQQAGSHPRLTARRMQEYFAAILLGNAIYLLSLSPYPPQHLHHGHYRIDWGLGLDFLTCAAVYGLIRLVACYRLCSREANTLVQYGRRTV